MSPGHEQRFPSDKSQRSELPAPIVDGGSLNAAFGELTFRSDLMNLIVSRIDTFGRVPLENGRSIVAQMEKL
jgi:hypothetical protein